MDRGWQEDWSLVLIWEYIHMQCSLLKAKACPSESTEALQHASDICGDTILSLCFIKMLMLIHAQMAHAPSLLPAWAVKPFWWIFIFENFSFISLGINPCKFSHKCSLPSSLPDWAVTVWGEWLANKNYHLKMVWHACIWFSMSECSGGMKGTLVF